MCILCFSIHGSQFYTQGTPCQLAARFVIPPSLLWCLSDLTHACCSDADGNLKVWDLATWRTLQTQRCALHSASTKCCALIINEADVGVVRLHPAAAGIIAVALSQAPDEAGTFELIRCSLTACRAAVMLRCPSKPTRNGPC